MSDQPEQHPSYRRDGEWITYDERTLAVRKITGIADPGAKRGDRVRITFEGNVLNGEWKTDRHGTVVLAPLVVCDRVLEVKVIDRLTPLPGFEAPEPDENDMSVIIEVPGQEAVTTSLDALKRMAGGEDDDAEA